MWNVLFGWMLGTTAGNTRLPDEEKQRRFDARSGRKDARVARKEEKRARIAATRAGWGPVQWMICIAVGVAICVLVYR